MGSYFQRIFLLLFGPTVYRVHKPPNGRQAYDFPMNPFMEKSQYALKIAAISKQVAWFTSPVWSIFFYRRGYFSIESAFETTKLVGYTAFTLFFVLVIRAFGRQRCPEYMSFLDILEMVRKNPKDRQIKKTLRAYDFDFHYWPVDFRFDEVEHKKQHSASTFWGRACNSDPGLIKTTFISIPKEITAYVIAHTIGIGLMYPGSMVTMGMMLEPALRQSRNKVVEEQNGLRAKLLASDGNKIDTMFLDRRARDHPKRYEQDSSSPYLPGTHGNTLVVCCEGNAGFYEVGCMCTPTQLGYSVLGWNHPGFAGSTGKPFPEAERNAIDVVMQYAIHRLGFQPENILLFGWSIGCFSVINAANMYPEVQGIILDSTFYDVMPFAKNFMPESLSSLVTYTVRNYLNLHNSENLKKYTGPVSFIRRTSDEVMNIDGVGKVQSNLGNLLLESFLRHRFPELFESVRPNEDKPGTDEQSQTLWNWLTASGDGERESILYQHAVDPYECKVLLESYMRENSSSFPILIGKGLASDQKTRLVLHLANQYMLHYTSSHCTPLPGEHFRLPWKVESLVSRTHSLSDVSSSSDFEVVGGNPNL